MITNTNFKTKFLSLFLILSLITLTTLNAQHFIIKGTVYDETNTPLYAATIVEVGTLNGTISNETGNFSLELAQFGERKIDVMYVGYHKQSFEFSGVVLPTNRDTIFQDITIHMKIDTTDYTPRKTYRRVYSMIIATTGSRVKSDMSSFTELPVNYIEGFNDIEYTIDIEMGGYYNSIFGSGHYSGAFYNPIVSTDSIKETAHMYDVGLKFGYGFATRNYWLVFTPYIGVDVLSYKLKKVDPNETIPLNQYLQNQYYNVTFRQWTSILGANLDVKLFGSRKGSPWGYTSMHLRMGAGYMFRLSKHPYIYAPTNDITSVGSFDMDNLYLNAGLVFYLQN